MRNYLKYFLAVFLFAFVCNASAQTTKWRAIHKVKKSETIFGIAREYGISIQDLIDANPEMKQPGYELKKDNWVFVPFAKKGDKTTDNETAATTKNASTTIAASAFGKKAKPNDGVIRVGVMLPLHKENGDGTRMIEYYRGMLLALNQLKAEGINTEVNAWNVPIDADIRATLQKEGVSNLDIVFGPLYSNMVKPLGDYCKANDIKMVIPFSITGNEVAENPNIFQVYQSPEEITNKSIAAFLERFPTHHPIFINCNDETSDKGTFTAGLRKQLDAKQLAYNLTNVNTPQADFVKAFNVNKPNVIVVNTAKSPQLNQVFAKLDSLKQTHPGLAISMFGYTEWLMYQKHDLAQFFKYGVYIPTTFYYNAVADRTEALEKLYKESYGEPMNSNALPRFAITGYDHAMFFIRGLKQQGAKFNGSSAQSTYKPLQTRLNFKRVGNGGYKNNHFQLVHFMSNQTMEAITY
ncbi:MAG: ABC transporter substrate-binding protein [Prevotella sp.]|nr:ABC transporter substrate-binding protein [Prevotella sp.]